MKKHRWDDGANKRCNGRQLQVDTMQSLQMFHFLHVQRKLFFDFMLVSLGQDCSDSYFFAVDPSLKEETSHENASGNTCSVCFQQVVEAINRSFWVFKAWTEKKVVVVI